jgi:hypothetical protein
MSPAEIQAEVAGSPVACMYGAAAVSDVNQQPLNQMRRGELSVSSENNCATARGSCKHPRPGV